MNDELGEKRIAAALVEIEDAIAANIVQHGLLEALATNYRQLLRVNGISARTLARHEYRQVKQAVLGRRQLGCNFNPNSIRHIVLTILQDAGGEVLSRATIEEMLSRRLPEGTHITKYVLGNTLHSLKHEGESVENVRPGFWRWSGPVEAIGAAPAQIPCEGNAGEGGRQ